MIIFQSRLVTARAGDVLLIMVVVVVCYKYDSFVGDNYDISSPPSQTLKNKMYHSYCYFSQLNCHHAFNTNIDPLSKYTVIVLSYNAFSKVVIVPKSIPLTTNPAHIGQHLKEWTCILAALSPIPDTFFYNFRMSLKTYELACVYR